MGTTGAKSTPGRAYATYLGALLLFGTNGIVASSITLASFEIVYLRTLIGSLLLVAVFAVTRQKLTLFQHPRQALCLVLSGAALGASWMFLYEAYQQIGVGLASLAYYCGPVIVMALSPLLFRERLGAGRVMCFGAVLAGIFLVSGCALEGGASSAGLVCGALSAVMYACMVVFSKKAPAIKGLENSMVQLVAAFLTVAAFVVVRQGPLVSLTAADWPGVLILGLVNTGIGCYLYFSSINRLPVQSVAVCGYLEPLSAVVLSAAVLGEQLALPQVVGAALIVGGAAASELLPHWSPSRAGRMRAGRRRGAAAAGLPRRQRAL